MSQNKSGRLLKMFAAAGVAGCVGFSAAHGDGVAEDMQLEPAVNVILPGVVCSAPTPAQRESALEAIGEMEDKRMVRVGANITRGAGGLDIQYDLSPAVAAAPGWVDALEQAALVWENVIDDPVTILFGVDFTSNQGFIAATSTPRFASTYSTARSVLVSDSSTAEFAYLDALPQSDATFATTQGNLVSQSLGGIALSNANRKALGLSSALNPGEADGSIVFNTDFTFDTDPSDGVVGVDVVFVMVHELGHALGFISGVDVFSDPSNVWVPHSMDLFRGGVFGASNDWDNATEFGTFEREFRPNVECAMDTFNALPFDAFRFSTGSNNGDGRQASHWKDDSLLGLSEVIGVMDPTFNGAQNPPGLITDADLLAFSLIGWDIKLPGLCDPDLNGDGVVDSADLAILLGAWGTSGPGDLSGDNFVGSTDLAVLLGGWGPC